MSKKAYNYYDCEQEVDSIVEIAERAKKLYGDSVAYVYKVKRQKREKTFNDLVEDSNKLAQFILRQKLEKGHVALLGTSSYGWVSSYYGLMYAGHVVIPVDKELTTENIHSLLEQADTEFLLHDRVYADVAEDLVKMSGGKLKSFCYDEEIVLEGEDLPLPEVDPDKLSAILFTSGTTGKNKGVMLTQRNIARNALAGTGHVKFYHDTDVSMSVLPMSHAYECTGTLFVNAYYGVKTCICSGLKYMQKELLEYRPTVMFVVPLIPQKLYEKVLQTAKKQGKEKKLMTGIRICKIARKFGIDLTDKLLGEVKAAFGGRLRIFMAGGAPLSHDLLVDINNLGINLFQGYGLTECSPLVAANFDWYTRPHSVGKVVRGCEAKVVDGEIWARGISVSTGYYNDPESTKESFEDGWFKTGDLGYIDEDDFIFVTGRKKNLIILGNGKNVAAEEIEDMIYKHLPYVSEVVVTGKDDVIEAEIYLNPEMDPVDEKTVNADIAKLNTKLAFYKNIASVKFRSEPFPRTSTKKIIRHKA